MRIIAAEHEFRFAAWTIKRLNPGLIDYRLRRTRGTGMGKSESYDDDVKILHRMIAYLRDEAERLRIVDVARLMEQAEDAIGACVSGSDDDDHYAYAHGDRELLPTEH